MNFLFVYLAIQGLALINGTQLITGLGLEALHRAELISKQANVVAALSLETLCGHPGVFDEGKIPRLKNACVLLQTLFMVHSLLQTYMLLVFTRDRMMWLRL